MAEPKLPPLRVMLVDDHGAKHPAIRVLMLTSFADDEALFASIMAGASGYVLKQVRSGELVRAIRAVVVRKREGTPCSGGPAVRRTLGRWDFRL